MSHIFFNSAKINLLCLTCKSQLLTIGIILTIKASLIHLIFTFTDYQLYKPNFN